MKLECGEPLSNFAFNFNLRRYCKAFPIEFVLEEGETVFIPRKWPHYAVVGLSAVLIGPSKGR